MGRRVLAFEGKTRVLCHCRQTGDNIGTARAIVDQAGVDEVHAELLPEDNVSVVESWIEKYGQVAMIGEGVNDAPALARATLGIAMGAALILTLPEYHVC